MQYLLVPVIMACTIGGSIGALKLIQKVFPDSFKTTEKTQEWIDKHSTQTPKSKDDSKE